MSRTPPFPFASRLMATPCSAPSTHPPRAKLAFIGLLGIATGDSWTFEVRAMTTDGDLDWQVAAFFVTFILFVGIILLNVILTVLIEGFMSSIQEEEERERINAEIREHHRMAGALDPLLATLANFRWLTPSIATLANFR